mgnify:CR=1 FL=1
MRLRRRGRNSVHVCEREKEIDGKLDTIDRYVVREQAVVF